jgi:lycopene beta-cyclase
MEGLRVVNEVVPIPPALLRPVSERELASAVLILGAGCAGLALALDLRRQGFERPIVLLDRRSSWTDDRVWCFWSGPEEDGAELATAAWSRWAVRGAGRPVERSARRTAYRRVRSGDFTAAAFAELAALGGVRLHPRERVLDVVDRPGRAPMVRTTQRTYAPHLVVDARGPRLDRGAAERLSDEGVWLGQEFVGRTVRAARPVFDPGTCTLMDFRLDQQDGVRFLYVLPTSSTEALVESVHFSARTRVDVAGHRARIADHLRRVHGLEAADVTVLGEERGCIPMTTDRPPTVLGPRHYVVGAAGGAVRPSSGYAFLRIRRASKRIAADICAGRIPTGDMDTARRRLLDDVFLHFLQAEPALVPAVFARMFARCPSPALVRFLTDRSTLIDEALLVAALPKRPFLAVLLRLAAARLARRRAPIRRFIRAAATS